MSCLLITLKKCLKGHKSLGLLLGGVSQNVFVFAFLAGPPIFLAVHLFFSTFLAALALAAGSALMAAWAFLYIPSMLSAVTPFLMNLLKCFLNCSSSSSCRDFMYSATWSPKMCCLCTSAFSSFPSES